MTEPNAHSSIGEVLSLLQVEYPDITISKIRFLESQGLLNPERTPSGYRKFHEDDIERLRWILTQQRDHFLPLKVIKDRLAAGDFAEGPPEGVLPFERAATGSATTADVMVALDDTIPLESEDTVSRDAAAKEEPGSIPLVPEPAPTTNDPVAPVGNGSRERAHVIAALVEGPAPSPVSAPRTRRRHPTGHTKGDPTPISNGEDEIAGPPVALTLEELCSQSGLTKQMVADLERFDLLSIRSMGHVDYYDEEALVVARLAAGFARFGIEPRHLRMYKVSAEREAGLFEQLITPLLKQRRAAAREQAVEMLEELAELADDLRAVMVTASLREYLGQS